MYRGKQVKRVEREDLRIEDPRDPRASTAVRVVPLMRSAPRRRLQAPAKADKVESLVAPVVTGVIGAPVVTGVVGAAPQLEAPVEELRSLRLRCRVRPRASVTRRAASSAGAGAQVVTVDSFPTC